MADALEKLLTAIVERPLMSAESREAQIDATAVQDVNAEIAKIRQDRHEDARRFAPYFARGLRMAAQGPLVVDDTTADGNMIADAFARFLVTPGLATSESTTVGEGHFRYRFDVNWPQIKQIADAVGINLDEALAGGSAES